MIEWIEQDGKTYVVVNDYTKLRELLGRMLREVQRIKSEAISRPAKHWSRNMP
mgnify:FL=1